MEVDLPKNKLPDTYSFELRYDEKENISPVDLNIMKNKQRFHIIKKEFLKEYLNAKILIVGDDKYNEVLGASISELSNITTFLEKRCSFHRAIELVDEYLTDEYNYVLILAFECEFICYDGDQKILKRMQPYSFEELVDTMSTTQENWIEKCGTKVNFLWILPYVANFLNGFYTMNAESTISFINDLKMLMYNVDSVYTLTQDTPRCLNNRCKVVPLQNILSPAEKITMYETASTLDYFKFMNRAKISVELNPCYFWKMIFKNCFDIWYMAKSFQFIQGGISKIQKAIINYDNIKLNVELPQRQSPNSTHSKWIKSQILMINSKSSMVPDLHYCKNSSFPHIYYEKSSFDATLTELMNKKLPLETLDVILVSPFDWILDECHKEDFELRNCLDKMKFNIMNINKLWSAGNCELKIIWLLPYPRQYNKFSTNQSEHYTEGDYRSIKEFLTIKQIILFWAKIIPDINMISLLDVMLSERQQLSFLNGSGKLLWKDDWITSKETGSIPLPAFTYRICLVIQRIYFSLVSDKLYCKKINMEYNLNVKKQCIRKEEQKDYEDAFENYYDIMDEVKQFYKVRDPSTPPKEWSLIWRSMVKSKPLSMQPEDYKDGDFVLSYGNYYIWTQSPRRIRGGGGSVKTHKWKTFYSKQHFVRSKFYPEPILRDEVAQYKKKLRLQEKLETKEKQKDKKSKKAKKGKQTISQRGADKNLTKNQRKNLKKTIRRNKKLEEITEEPLENYQVKTNKPKNFKVEKFANYMSEEIQGRAKTMTNFNTSLSSYKRPGAMQVPSINPIICAGDNGIKVDVTAVATRGLDQTSIINYVREVLQFSKRKFSHFDLQEAVELVVLKHKHLDEIENISTHSSSANIKPELSRHPVTGNMITSSNSIFDRINAKVGNPSTSGNYQLNRNNEQTCFNEQGYMSTNTTNEANKFSWTVDKYGHLRNEDTNDRPDKNSGNGCQSNIDFYDDDDEEEETRNDQNSAYRNPTQSYNTVNQLNNFPSNGQYQSRSSRQPVSGYGQSLGSSNPVTSGNNHDPNNYQSTGNMNSISGRWLNSSVRPPMNQESFDRRDKGQANDDLELAGFLLNKIN